MRVPRRCPVAIMHLPRRAEDQHRRQGDHERRRQFREQVRGELCAIRDSDPCRQRVHWQRQQRPDWRVAVVKVSAQVDEVIRNRAGPPLHGLRDEFIKNQIAVAQDAERDESRRVRVVGRDLPEVDVVCSKKTNEEEQ